MSSKDDIPQINKIVLKNENKSAEINIPNMLKHNEELKKLFIEMEERLIERDQALRLIALTFFAKTNCFILGERGTGKTHMIELLGNVVKGSKKLWQLLLKKDTKSDEIFGRTYQADDGEWKINTKNSLLDSTNVMLDEMFKADGKILSSLLEVLVDRHYSFGDGNKIKTDIIAFFGISNEYPTEHFMFPFVDRFMIWIEVEGIKQRENRINYYLGNFNKTAIEGEYFSMDDIEAIYDESKKVSMSFDIVAMYTEITIELIKNKVKTSDRKYKEIIELVKTIAYLNGRTYVNRSDLFILMHSAWHNEHEKIKVKEVLMRSMFDCKENIDGLIEEICRNFSEQETANKKSFFKILNHSEIFSGGNQMENYNNHLDNLKILEQNLIYLLEVKAANIYKIYDKNKAIEEEIQGNIFILGIKENTFGTNEISKFKNIETALMKKQQELKIWIENNDELFKYKTNQLKVKSRV